MPPLTILSCGIDPCPDSPRLAQWSKWGNWANLVYGSTRLLKLAPEWESKGVPLGADARLKAQEALTASRNGQNILLLASGDALFHGIGGTIRSLASSDDELTFIPAETAFQALFHRLGQPWNEARLFSAHFSGELPLAEILSSPLSVVYGGASPAAADIARLCIEWFPPCSERMAVLAENLGTEKERICQGTLAQLAQLAGETSEPTAMLVLLPTEQAGQSPTLPLGRSNTLYEKENKLITGEEVRAVILSKLKIPAWGILWDIGAGSGSVGLEAAALRPNLDVHGLEKNESRLGMIRNNKSSLGIINYTLHHGSAPGGLDELPPPDRIFIGGGGRDLALILNACYDQLNPEGIIVASSVTMESQQTLYSWHPERRQSFLELTVSREQSIAGSYHCLEAQNRISIFSFSKP